jgi:NTE family protein
VTADEEPPPDTRQNKSIDPMVQRAIVSKHFCISPAENETTGTKNGPSRLRHQSNPPACDRIRTAFVLGGGGSIGAAQVGMLYALLEAGIRPDFVVGTSIGALNGAYLTGHPSLKGMESLGELWSSVRRPDIFRVSVRGLLRGATGARDHLFETQGLRALIGRAQYGFAHLEEAPIPIHVVSTDLLSGEPVVLSRGRTTESLLASAAIPGIFPPVTIEGRLLVDGGVVANLPVSQAVALGARRLFVLPVLPDEVTASPASAVDMFQRGAMITSSMLTRRAMAAVPPSVELHVLPVPRSAQGSIFDFKGTPTLIEDSYLLAAAWLHAVPPRAFGVGADVHRK